MNKIYKKYETEIQASQKKLVLMLGWILDRYKLHHLITISSEPKGIRIYHNQADPVVDMWIVFDTFESKDDHRRKDPCWVCVQYSCGFMMQLVDGYCILHEFDEPHHGPRENFLEKVIAQFFILLIGREMPILKKDVLSA
jgi:hypothetical protein